MYRVTPWRRVLAHTSTRLRGWPRLVLAAGCVALAASSGLSARSNADPRATVPVVVASHALAAGTVLR
nr:hypothetical protein [Actinomycetota bacterium]